MQVMKVNLSESDKIVFDIAEKGIVEDLMHLYLVDQNPAVEL